jgi:hypothetical protein
MLPDRRAMPTALALALALLLAQRDCAELQLLVRETYDFRPSQLDAKQQQAKAARMDAFWTRVKQQKATLLPCLRSALEAGDADPWFRVDGSALLVEVEPTQASKELQARLWSNADLDDLAPEVWMGTLATRAAEGLDVSVAAKRWMERPRTFTIAKHALDVNLRYGARFLLGSMDEAQALAVLEPIAADPKNPAREVALDVIASLATPEALRALKRIGLEGCEEKTRKAIAPLLGAWKAPPKRSPGPKTSRTLLLKALNEYVAGKPEKYAEIEASSEHWGAEVLGALKLEDLPLLRKVRRLRASCMSDEALDSYSTLSGVLMALVWKPEYVK